MSETVIVAMLALIGTLVGSVTGILTANKLVNFRIQKLEERINQMDTLDQRLDNLELKQAMTDTVVESLRREVDRNIDDIRKMKANGDTANVGRL